MAGLPKRVANSSLAMATSLVVGVLAMLVFRLATEPGPPAPRWLPSMPWHARLQGYGLFRLWERGRAPKRFVAPVPNPAGPLAVDLWHARKQPYDSFLASGERTYDAMHGLGRAFDPARIAGVEFRELGWKLAWDAPSALSGASALFINLASGDGPGFRWSEVRAISSFVRAGGGLLLIADHTNCYGHQDMLAQLAGELGFGLLPVTAADPEMGLGERAKSWFRAVDILPHPVTEGVVATGWMNAGGVSGLNPLVRSSATSWADIGEPSRRGDSSGFTGDLERGATEVGPVTVAAAGEVGLGRVVVLADQNAFGATMIGYGDNQRLFNNAVGWVLRRKVEELLPQVVTIGTGCADAYEHGFRSLQVALAARGRDACEGATTALRRVILPSASATLPQPGTFTVRVESFAVTLPLRWDEAGDPGGRIFAWDASGARAVFEREGELVVAAALLDNAALGDERADPAAAEFVEGNVTKDNVLQWLFE